ncbi:hypothetical protein C1645_835235 [Glomus cerebriforme]|uniref:F-box domain-containing protein n=1 Tax=Glomus cerebriforme TaxID=658196 RepID=A0A397S846_9GLOM|nr:hypothetical protein C1645_835235 [Glomus cerebriforme]
MPCQLPADCLNEIFEHLENDKYALHSCLLTNRLWCKISVRILWRNIWNFIFSVAYQHQFKNKIFIPTPTSKLPLFNYPAFFKVFSITDIFEIICDVLEKIPITSLSLKGRGYLLIGDCLIDLSELYCSSDLTSEFFYQLSQKCHNLLSLTLRIETMNFDIELKKLISLQNNLKNLRLNFNKGDWTDIIPILTNHYNTLTKLHLYGNIKLIPLSFVALFPNLQEIIFSFYYGLLEGFEKLQHVTFPKLQILNIPLYPVYQIFCQYLESIKFWCGEDYLGEKENCFIINLENNEEIMKAIEKYKNLGVIKFKTGNF